MRTDNGVAGMLANNRNAFPSSADYAAVPTPPESRPLTAEVMTQLELAIDAANRSHGQLYELRNRLFGYPPEKEGSQVGKNSAAGFSEAYRERAETLSELLLFIERLSNELANRL